MGQRPRARCRGGGLSPAGRAPLLWPHSRGCWSRSARDLGLESVLLLFLAAAVLVAAVGGIGPRAPRRRQRPSSSPTGTSHRRCTPGRSPRASRCSPSPFPRRRRPGQRAGRPSGAAPVARGAAGPRRGRRPWPAPRPRSSAMPTRCRRLVDQLRSSFGLDGRAGRGSDRARVSRCWLPAPGCRARAGRRLRWLAEHDDRPRRGRSPAARAHRRLSWVLRTSEVLRAFADQLAAGAREPRAAARRRAEAEALAGDATPLRTAAAAGRVARPAHAAGVDQGRGHEPAPARRGVVGRRPSTTCSSHDRRRPPTVSTASSPTSST